MGAYCDPKPFAFPVAWRGEDMSAFQLHGPFYITSVCFELNIFVALFI